MEFKEDDFKDIHFFVNTVQQALKDKDQEIEDLKQRLHYLKDQRDDLNDDLITTVDIVLNQKYCIKVLKESLNKYVGRR